MLTPPNDCPLNQKGTDGTWVSTDRKLREFIWEAYLHFLLSVLYFFRSSALHPRIPGLAWTLCLTSNQVRPFMMLFTMTVFLYNFFNPRWSESYLSLDQNKEQGVGLRFSVKPILVNSNILYSWYGSQIFRMLKHQNGANFYSTLYTVW